MAALAPLPPPPARQAFGVLESSKLRSLQSVKNRQNAITATPTSFLKRRAASPELSDSENVDPNLLDASSKRKRAAFGDDVSLSKPSRYSFSTVPTSRPKVFSAAVTPRLDTLQRPSITPASAPAAAGRSPTRAQRPGQHLSRKRWAPPSFGSQSPALSITAALKGTLANKKARKIRTIEDSKPKSWFFDIYEESQVQQDDTASMWTMSQSAIKLDISDDESKAIAGDDEEKENIDPNEVSVPYTRSMAANAKSVAVPKVSRQDLMTDESRSPLSDLNPSDYYAEGLDATSVVLVQDEVEAREESVEKTKPVVDVGPGQDFTFDVASTATSAFSDKLDAASIGALIMASAPSWESFEPGSSKQVEPVTELLIDPLSTDGTDIEIWESESAKDENEGEGFALQEL